MCKNVVFDIDGTLCNSSFNNKDSEEEIAKSIISSQKDIYWNVCDKIIEYYKKGYEIHFVTGRKEIFTGVDTFNLLKDIMSKYNIIISFYKSNVYNNQFYIKNSKGKIIGSLFFFPNESNYINYIKYKISTFCIIGDIELVFEDDEKLINVLIKNDFNVYKVKKGIIEIQ